MTGQTSTRAGETRPGTSDVRIATVTSAAAFAALEERWNEVAASAAPSSVFHRHEWYSAAWAWRRLDSTLALLTATAEGNLAGILPLIRPAHRRGRTRRLELLTVPDTQLADLIVSPEDGPHVATALAAELARLRDWDTLRLDYLPARGAVAEFLVPALTRRGMRVRPEERGGNPHVALAGTWNDYYNARSRGLKKAVNLAANRLHKAGDVRIDWITSENSDPSRFEAALDAAVDLSRRSWKRDTGNALDQAGPQAFIRALSHAAYHRGWASIWLIYVDERPLAMEYQLIHDGDVHALRADFDADCTDISPGSHLFRHLLEPLFGRGWRRYYLGPGDNPYKRRWTRDEEPLTRVIVYNRTWRGGRAWLRDRWVKPALRAARDLLRRGRGTDSDEHAHSQPADRLKP